MVPTDHPLFSKPPTRHSAFPNTKIPLGISYV